MNILPIQDKFSDISDEKLVLFVKKGDKDAFSEIFKRYWKPLSQYAIQKTNSVDVGKEIIQELFLTLWERHADLKIDSLKAYLFSAVKYKVIAELKNKIIKNTENIQDFEIPAHIDFHDFQLDELNQRLNKCLDKLPKKTNEIFRKSRQEELSHKDISVLYDISEKSVEYHITQALKLIKLDLKEFLPSILIGSFFL